MTDKALLERLDRVESMLAIQQLPIRYAIAVDTRNIDAWLQLFVEDVDCGRRGKGREVLRGFIDPSVRTFYRSMHQILGHQVDLVDADKATGIVYCRAEHEVGDKWVVMGCVYFDTYERRKGQWFFARREEDFYYTSDVLEQPMLNRRWPGPPPRHNPPFMHPRFPSWKEYWSKSTADEIAALTKNPV